MKERKFFVTIVKVQVLSEDKPVEFDNLRDLHEITDSGPCSGNYWVEKTQQVSGRKMARLLDKQGSDPSFFRLDESGNTTD